MTRHPITLPLSDKATGIPDVFTKTVAIKGVDQFINIMAIVINISGNNILVKGERSHLNNEGEPLSHTKEAVQYVILDQGEVGTVEHDENDVPIMSTYKQVRPENLAVTNWAKDLWDKMMPQAIAYSQHVEGYGND